MYGKAIHEQEKRNVRLPPTSPSPYRKSTVTLCHRNRAKPPSPRISAVGLTTASTPACARTIDRIDSVIYMSIVRTRSKAAHCCSAVRRSRMEVGGPERKMEMCS